MLLYQWYKELELVYLFKKNASLSSSLFISSKVIDFVELTTPRTMSSYSIIEPMSSGLITSGISRDTYKRCTVPKQLVWFRSGKDLLRPEMNWFAYNLDVFKCLWWNLAKMKQKGCIKNSFPACQGFIIFKWLGIFSPICIFIKVNASS